MFLQRTMGTIKPPMVAAVVWLQCFHDHFGLNCGFDC